MITLASARHADRGSVSVFVAIVFVAVLFVVAMIVDGGRIRAGRRQAGDIAQQAARRAAQQIDVGPTLGLGDVEVDGSATAAANEYLAARGATGTVVLSGASEVTVTVTLDVDLLFFDLGATQPVSATRVSDATGDL